MEFEQNFNRLQQNKQNYKSQHQFQNSNQYKQTPFMKKSKISPKILSKSPTFPKLC